MDTTSDTLHIQNLNNKDMVLPLYDVALSDGRRLRALLDTGTSTNYISPNAAHGLPCWPVRNKEVERVRGHNAAIMSWMSLRLSLAGASGNIQAYISQRVFLLILGQTWFKLFEPQPTWTTDEWFIRQHCKGHLLRPLLQSDFKHTEEAFLISARQLQ